MELLKASRHETFTIFMDFKLNIKVFPTIFKPDTHQLQAGTCLASRNQFCVDIMMSMWECPLFMLKTGQMPLYSIGGSPDDVSIDLHNG